MFSEIGQITSEMINRKLYYWQTSVKTQSNKRLRFSCNIIISRMWDINLRNARTQLFHFREPFGRTSSVEPYGIYLIQRVQSKYKNRPKYYLEGYLSTSYLAGLGSISEQLQYDIWCTKRIGFLYNFSSNTYTVYRQQLTAYLNRRSLALALSR